MKDIFSERMGLVKIELFANDCPPAVRNRVCNLIIEIIRSISSFRIKTNLCKTMIDRFHKRLISDFDGPFKRIDYEYEKFVEKYSSECKWFEFFDFIEHFHASMRGMRDAQNKFKNRLNVILEEERMLYRMIDGRIVPISDDVEKAVLECVTTPQFQFSGARKHIKAALVHFSHRPAPDYRNVIKEAISAVESVCKIVAEAENDTLGKALRKLEKDSSIHPSLSSAFKKLYGYTNDEKGIRHSLLEDSEKVSEAEAHFMIVACAAFVNYVVNIYASKK